MKLETKIIELIHSNINFEGQILMESTLIEDLSIGSFDRLMIVNAVEDTFSVEVKDEDLVNLKTVGDIVDMVRGRVGNQFD